MSINMNTLKFALLNHSEEDNPHIKLDKQIETAITFEELFDSYEAYSSRIFYEMLSDEYEFESEIKQIKKILYSLDSKQGTDYF